MAEHWASGRCWCGEFHRDQAETIELVAPPRIPGVPQFELAAQTAAHVSHDTCASCGRCRDCGGQHHITCPHR